MYKIKIILVILFLLNLNPLAQSQQEIQKELSAKGINSKAEFMAELDKRNMSESEARLLAKQYGLNYDDLINDFEPQVSAKGSTLIKPKITNPNIDSGKSKPIEKSLTELATTDTGKTTTKSKDEKELKHFGYDIFSDIPEAFKPIELGAIDPGYIIGPEDVLRLYLWGEVEFQYELVVDKQGNIFIPTVGQVFVSGTKYSDLKLKLINFLSKYYSGLTKDPPTIFLDISIASLKPVKIFVLGEVARPGGYNISSFATVFNALYSVGGPKVSGSLREIRVIRNNEVLTTIDLYDYLLKGKLIGDIRLQNNDIVFIPPRMKTIAIKGEILRPAIYELKLDENLNSILDYSGGLNSTAYIYRAQVNRIKPFNQRSKFEFEKEVIDIDLSKYIGSKKESFDLEDKDVIEIFPILDELENFVKIEGAVYRPGKYQIEKTPNIQTLVNEAYGLLPEAYLYKGDIFRTLPNKQYEFITFDLEKAMSGDLSNNISLLERDQITIYSIYDVIDRKSVSIQGYVKNPLSLPYADSLTLYDMIFKAGGLEDFYFKSKAYMFRGDLIRINEDGYTTNVIPFRLDEIISKQKNMDMDPGDKIYIYSANVDKVLEEIVTIKGEVRNPDNYRLDKNATIQDIILRAGGFNEFALKSKIYVNRLEKKAASSDTLTRTFSVEIDSNLYIKNKSIFPLKHRDIIVVRTDPNYEKQRQVTITGEVEYPGTYVLRSKNQTFLSLLNEAGGLTSEAFIFGTKFVRNERRVILDFEEIFFENNTSEDLKLEDGDQLFIPRRPSVVEVTGEVNSVGLFKYHEGWSVSEYIDLAGGLKDSANYAIYNGANGSSLRVNFGWFRSDPEVFDGGKIHVTKLPPPPKGKEIDVGGTIKDVFAIASSAVTVIYLVWQISR
ncbi:MAG: SLBB domain-containing protein [Melioribacteraceae bacterium]|nr:SLBB domain-containing protein [Melioribacteraceae bacterium]MCF8263510.1 SLBB domain-containing protein [Melioribacteraceae bacterium]